MEGKALRYLIGADIPRIDRNAVIEVGYDINYKINDDDIAYCNLFDEENSGRYGPYLYSSDTAGEYNEGQIDPNGPGWERNLTDQFKRRKQSGFRYIEMDNPDAYGSKDVLRAMDLARGCGFKVIAKNPGICDEPLAMVAHPAVVAIVVEKDCGTPLQMDTLRKEAGKPTLPVWFVYFGSGRSAASQCAKQASKFLNMGVTYSSLGEYRNSEDVLKPTA